MATLKCLYVVADLRYVDILEGPGKGETLGAPHSPNALRERQ